MRSLKPLDQADERACNVAKELHSLVQKLSLSAIEAGAKNPVHTMMILSQAANGLLHLLARAVMREGDEELPIHSTATLFAALASYHTGPFEVEKGKVQAEYSPLVIFEVLKDMEKLTGQRPDDRLNETMCRVARECAVNPAIIAQIAKERAAMQRGSATLN